MPEARSEIAPAKTSGFATAALVLAFLPINVLLSVIFGILALIPIRRYGRRGRGLAIADSPSAARG
ncbi:hypothetical protein VSH64_24545 [Amycolatopsis rhabdoformis]|uniref:DUF4190 domain-containing protein n=1 Tax=Amycolatopsis rhabdoformis TaxID=1448059 RepID=A0ABZ1HX06_9PSEU|nr:hypothetical protein [Amycolatopsis rhabdoformis]WSE26051.1 hypothetical protein VSH64_24545 [Amycolatopsis rhabdoformis]